MSEGGYKVFIVEGDREKELFENIKQFFFATKKIKFVTLPAEQNIYMLWKTLKDDEYQTDIVEVLKEKVGTANDLLAGIERKEIDEVFLIFDFDRHQDNLPHDVSPDEVLDEMLRIFCDETDQGKLYISYPMIEAIRDWSWDKCNAFYKCALKFSEFGEYKTRSAENNPNVIIGHYGVDEWRNIFKVFVMRLRCLFELQQVPSQDFYRKNITPYNIYLKQKAKYINKNQAFILSFVPEFLLDYFGDSFWKCWIKCKKLRHGVCNK